MRYVTLLRGINVGGNNIIKMADLRSAFLSAGYTHVTTYIQSGNVIFDSPLTNIDKLAVDVEALLSTQFNYDARVVIKSLDGMRKIVDGAPLRWQQAEDIRCYVAFVRPPATREEVVKAITINPAVDVMTLGLQVVYMTTLSSGLTKSGFTKLIGTPIYKHLTMRNWNTTRKILELMRA